MYIKWNDTNVHALGHISQGAQKLNQSPEMIAWLRPGWNNFPSGLWAQYKDHPQIKHFLKMGKIELMNEKVTVTEGRKKVSKVVGQSDEQLSITLFEEKRAIQIVKATYDRDILNQWLDDEQRMKVRKALEKQVAPLLASKSDDEDEDDDEDDVA